MKETIIHNFNIDAKYYYDKGITAYDDGRYWEAIDDLYRAYLADRSEAWILLDVAACYAQLEEHEAALSLLYKVVALEDPAYREAAFSAIIQSLIALNRHAEAVYYIRQGADDGILGDEYDVEIDRRGGDFHVLLRTDRRAQVEMARRLIATGEHEYALELLRGVPTDSKQYLDALNLISEVQYREEKFLDCAIVTDAALKIDPRNVTALTNRILAMQQLGNQAEVDRSYQILITIEPSEHPMLMRIATCMLGLRQEEQALRYFTLASRRAPLNRNVSLAIGILQHNLGMKEKSRATMLSLAKTYPADDTVTYYTRKLYYDDERYDVRFTLPDAEIKERLKEIEERLYSLKDVVKVTSYAKKHPEFYEQIRWLLLSDCVRLSGHVAQFLSQHAYWHPLIREMLVCEHIPYMPKKDCLPTFLRNAKKKSFCMYVQDILRFYKPKLPREGGEALLFAYWNVYAILAFVSSDFEGAIMTAYKRFVSVVCRLTEEQTAYDPMVFAAVFALHSGLHPLFSAKDAVCELLDVPIESVAELSERYELAEKSVTK